MEKQEFIEKMSEVKRAVKPIEFSSYTCGLVFNILGYEARNAYSKFFDLGKYSFDATTNVSKLWKMSEKHKQQTRLAMLEIFEEMCLDKQLYKNF